MEQLKDMTTDYDEGLDEVVWETPEVYPYENENVSLLCLWNMSVVSIKNQVGP